ncbi:RNA polymerase II-associated factor [Raphidocelis subcapitata]|uniref:RNA polymerase II-associated factor n=1 Tax=Raphidocelis subcapitata TaxID=307507 RepID=A0A2V0P5F9_9CHLO|nr:RNA polymerase II-associated factor [Raphidocelis subcapitata]|eukprot:GBF92417.1 RNA polymerase II-associated factor [Raphidocelis subcapitata]
MAQLGAPPMGPPGAGARPPPPPPAGNGPARQQQQQQHHRSGGGGSRSGGGSGSGGAPRARPAGGAPAPAAAAAAAAATSELDSRLRRDTPFICNIQFKNDLPEIPADPKLLLSLPEPSELSAFRLTSLERQTRRNLPLPADLGVPITLLDADRYNVPAPGEAGPLHPRDAALVEAEVRMPGQGPSPAKPKRFAGKAVEVSWLMRTTYVSATEEAAAAAGRRPGAARVAGEEGGDLSREGQIEEIEASFAAAQLPIVSHPRKCGVTALEVLPVLPDLERWPHKYIQVTFDEEPTIDGAMAAVPDPKLRRQLSDRTMLKSYNLAQGEGAAQVPALAMLVPKGALESARAGDPSGLPPSQSAGDLEGDYLWDQEYAWSQAGRRERDVGAQDAYLMRAEEDKIAYSVFAMDKLLCRKRKRRAEDDPVPEKVVLTNREPNAAEQEEQEERRHPDA